MPNVDCAQYGYDASLLILSESLGEKNNLLSLSCESLHIKLSPHCIPGREAVCVLSLIRTSVYCQQGILNTADSALQSVLVELLSHQPSSTHCLFSTDFIYSPHYQEGCLSFFFRHLGKIKDSELA